MKHRSGLDRSQTLMFPERLEDYIGAETPGRFLEAFVGTLDLHALGFSNMYARLKFFWHLSLSCNVEKLSVWR